MSSQTISGEREKPSTSSAEEKLKEVLPAR